MDSPFSGLRSRAVRDLVTVVGSTTSVSAGEHLEATGNGSWTGNTANSSRPTNSRPRTRPRPEGIEKYLASGAIRSIGPKFAAKIVGIYKERTLEIFETAPDFLLHIKGIGQERVKRIRQSWQEQKEVRKIMLFLAEHGITSGPGRPHLSHLRPGIHRQDQGEPVPTGRRHPGHWLQDRR